MLFTIVYNLVKLGNLMDLNLNVGLAHVHEDLANLVGNLKRTEKFDELILLYEH